MVKSLRSGFLGLAALALLPTVVSAATIRDEAKMFSPAAVERAKAVLDKVEREHKMPITVWTIESLNGENRLDAAESRNRETGRNGLFILISKRDKQLEVLPSKDFRSSIPFGLATRIRDAFFDEFRAGKMDEGLLAGAATIEGIAQERGIRGPERLASAQHRGVRQGAGKGGGGLGAFFWILAVILGVTVLIRIFSSLAGAGRAPQTGMGGPMGSPMGGPMGGGGGYGYPNRGGGFLSGLLGGLGGAIAGNWIYDQMSGRHRGYSPDGGDQYAGGEAGTDQGDNWGGGGGAGGSWDDGGGGAGGDWGGGDAGGGGGDWGGGGGGDWGGGGGGGDWGGGGGDGGGW